MLEPSSEEWSGVKDERYHRQGMGGVQRPSTLKELVGLEQSQHHGERWSPLCIWKLGPT